MKLFFTFIISAVFIVTAWAQPCSTTNASGCLCADGNDTCLLLPDLTISWYAIINYQNGPNEYSQTGNGADNGRLKLTGSTPNIGYGSFTVRGSDYFLCGTDTIVDPNRNPTCSNGNSPTNLLTQRVYKKMGNTMTYEDHWAGGQTFHPTHGHNHVDDWVSFTLRLEDANNPDTLSWAIVGVGSKIGFCLMDYGSCSYYNGHCRDRQVPYGQGTVLTQANFPNYGLGGGNYNCSPVEQGISSGYTDIYDEGLDGMWINIPPTACNGNYWIVAQVDPNNNFLESNENNNWTAVPITLTKQLPSGSAVASVSLSADKYLCNTETITLTASPATTYLWSTGATTQSIIVSDSGNYTVQTTSICGTATSPVIEIEKNIIELTDVVADTSCQARAMLLTANGIGTISWYDEPTGGNLLATGNTFTTPSLNTTTTYYAAMENVVSSNLQFANPHDHAGGNFSGNTYNGFIEFDAMQPFNLKSVKVYTDIAGTRIIELRNSGGTVLQSQTVNIPVGESRVTLNFSVPVGTALQLGTNEASNQTSFGYESPRLRRSDSGVNYPYVLSGVLSLNDSPYGTAYYYYFYDWEVDMSVTCTSPRVPVTALLDSLPLVSISGIDTSYELHAGTVTLTGVPAGGTFTGTGVTGNTFDPMAAGVGGPYQITYNYADQSSGCSNFTTASVSVYEIPTGIKNHSAENIVNIYPNPSTSNINIEMVFEAAGNVDLKIFNAVGELVFDKSYQLNKGKNMQQVNIASFARGLYFGEIKSGNTTSNFRFLKL
jgi:hypothetical protein